MQASWATRAGAPGRARHNAKRERRVELAAAEAAEDDPEFAPDKVRATARSLFFEIQKAWDAEDRVHLRGLVAPDLLAEWERRLDDFDRRGWRNHVQPLGEPTIEYVGSHRTRATPTTTASWSGSTRGSRTTWSTATAAT